MDNVFTLMLFLQNQQQGVSLHYKDLQTVQAARDTLTAEGADRVVVGDDFGRELTIRPCDVQIAFLQDVDRAIDSDATLAAKNNVSATLGQMRRQDGIDTPRFSGFPRFEGAHGTPSPPD